MSGIYTKVRFRNDQSTSRAEVKHEGISEDTSLVLISQGNESAVFQADVVEKDTFDLDKNIVKLNNNAKALFSGLKQGVDTVAVTELTQQNSLEAAKTVQIHLKEGEKEALRAYFSSGMRLIHPITEVIHTNTNKFKFEVVGTSPPSSSTQTFVVNENTTINFVDKITHGADTSNSTEGSADDSQRKDPESGERDFAQPYSEEVPEESFDDVVGLKEVKEHAQSLIDLYKGDTYDDLTAEYSEGLISRRDSVLFYGPPGCGKTMVSEAIANEFKQQLGKNVVFMKVKGSDILSKMKGESEKKVRAIFDDARSKATSGFTVLFFDEVENLIHDRSSGNLKPHQVSLTNAFLQEMNDVGQNLMVIGATNMPFKMDSAASRRFHTKLFLDHPGAEAMTEVWRDSLSEVQAKGDIDYEKLGDLSSEFTPAEINDQILGSTIQTELINHYKNGDIKIIDQEYLEEKIQEAEARSVSEYVSKVDRQIGKGKMEGLEGYEDLKDYVEEYN